MRPYLLVAVGIGITPALSVLRALADEGDPRQVALVYANRRWEDVAFRDELDQLADSLDLEIVHVLSDPHAGWSGPRGRVDEQLLAGVLADLPAEPNVLVCGPPPLVDATLAALRELGVPDSSVHAERFTSV
jgi:ferredoxin-NADP reductase